MISMLRKFFVFFLSLGLILISCASSPDIKERGITIAVWDLDDLSPGKTSRANLGEILSSRIIETLNKKEGYRVIERQRLLLALEELRLGTTSIVDESTRLTLGKIVAARFMVFGGYQVIGDKMRLDLRLVEVETGKIKKAVQKIASSANLQEWIDTAGRAAEEL
jgi:TolB-like protein